MSSVARQLVSIHSCSWIVTEVALGTLPPERSKIGLETPQHLLTLSLVEDDRLDEELQGIRESEPGAEATEGDGGNRLGLAGRVGAPQVEGFIHRLAETCGALVVGGLAEG